MTTLLLGGKSRIWACPIRAPFSVSVRTIRGVLAGRSLRWDGGCNLAKNFQATVAVCLAGGIICQRLALSGQLGNAARIGFPGR
jgi:hypothetical protein